MVRVPVRCLLIASLVIIACSSSGDDPLCDPVSGVTLDFGSCLVFEDNGELDIHREAIKAVVLEAVSLVNQKMSLDDLTIRVRSAPSEVIPEIGIGGFNPNEQEIIISFDANFNNLSQSIAAELGPTVAHEMHHAKRRRTVGYGATLLEACVSEGLADHLSVEIFGVDPPIWSTAVTGMELDSWIEEARNTWTNSTYDHPKWFFGTGTEIPRWTGYSIGYKLVNDYLASNPSRNASDLFDELAISFAN